MDMKTFDSFKSESSEDGLSNEDVDEDRSPLQYSPMPPGNVIDSGDEVFFSPQNETNYSSSQTDYSQPTSNYSPPTSNYSPASSNFQHSHTNIYNSYKPSYPSSSPRKVKADNLDSDGFSEYGSVDDGASTISSSSSNSSNSRKRRKFDFMDACAKEVQPDFNFAPKAHHIMKKMGFKEGFGLGRNEQGITAPIEASNQRGRSGIGHSVKKLEPAKLEWDDTYEEVSVEEIPNWLEGDHLQGLSHNQLRDWKKEGPRIMEMENFNDFCDSELLNDILESKSVFDNLDGKELLNAVKRSNPFETIDKGIFLNRAAMKMANMDKVFDFMFTNPLNLDNRPVVGEMDLLYFADVCAGPGGFSEYVLWRKNWQAKGIGFTLRNDCDFKLDDFLAGTPETFEPYYGAKGDGDVFDPENILSLTKFVMAKTDNLGVHFMMADGGFSVAGKENIQELMSKQLYLCQFLVALSIVRTGGHFVCKLFDIFSPFSVGLIYLMYHSFNKICLHKPNTSRPANSERYIICKYKRNDCEDIRKYMFDLNVRLFSLEPNSKIDVTDVVPLAEMISDNHFFNYIVNSNNKLGKRQLVHLKKVIAFCRDTTLIETKQKDLRLKCLEYWGVPIAPRTRKPDNTSAEVMAAKVLRNTSYDFAAEPGEELDSEEKLKVQFPSILDWKCIPVGNHNECHFYIGVRNRVYMLRKNGKGWTNLDPKIKLELTPGTLVYGEIVDEVVGEYKMQKRSKFFHIIDAFSLGDKNIMMRSYTTRIRLCKLYAKALHKHWQANSNNTSYNSSFSPVIYPMSLRANDSFELKHLMSIFHKVRITPNKFRHQEILIGLKDELPKFPDNNEDDEKSDIYYFPVKGILFYKMTKNPWTVHFSKSHNKIYYYRKDQNSVFEPPNDINAATIDCFVTRKLWTWDQGVGIKGESPKENVLHMNQLLNYIDSMHLR